MYMHTHILVLLLLLVMLQSVYQNTGNHLDTGKVYTCRWAGSKIRIIYNRPARRRDSRRECSID